MDCFLIFSYEILKLQKKINFLGLIRVDLDQPMQPGTQPLDRVNSQIGFNNYALRYH
jgi:hypothetical protein